LAVDLTSKYRDAIYVLNQIGQSPYTSINPIFNNVLHGVIPSTHPISG